MKVAHWGLFAVAVVLGIYGYVSGTHWLIYVAVGILLVAAALNPKRPFFGLRKHT